MNYGSSKLAQSHPLERGELAISDQRAGLDYTLDTQHLQEKLNLKNHKIKVLADVLSHQISGPVATMKGLMELIDGLPPGEIEQYLPLFRLVVEQMDQAVKDVTASAFDAAE